MPRTKNAIINRIHVRAWLLAALVGGLPLASHAYVFPSPPPGFGGSPGNWTFAPPSGTQQIGQIAYQSKAFTVPLAGNSVQMSAAYRWGVNAPKIAAAAIYQHPAIRTAVGVATLLSAAKIMWDEANKQWVTVNDTLLPPDQFAYWSMRGTTDAVQYNSLESACGGMLSYVSANSSNPDNVRYKSSRVLDGYCYIDGQAKSYGEWVASTDMLYGVLGIATRPCPPGSVAPDGQCKGGTVVPIRTQEEFETKISPHPMPQTVPFELPKPTPLPVEQPIINPEPVPNPQPKPLFVPTGDPVRNPQYNPDAPAGPDNQPWIQPGVKVQPSPTPSEPWRLDVQPVNRPQAGPEPLPEPAPDDPANPDKPKNEEQQSLCEKHPDILACAKPELDTPEGEISKTKREVTLTEENLFSGGSCPADVYFTPHGLQQLKVWDWNQSCSYITGYVKPILLICCTFAAFMILIPGRTE